MLNPQARTKEISISQPPLSRKLCQSHQETCTAEDPPRCCKKQEIKKRNKEIFSIKIVYFTKPRCPQHLPWRDPRHILHLHSKVPQGTACSDTPHFCSCNTLLVQGMALHWGLAWANTTMEFLEEAGGISSVRVQFL